jgi:hypothetical protein
MLANASDFNLCDSATMACATALNGGLLAGSLCYMGYTAGGAGGRIGSNSMVASATAITPISWGVVIRTQQMPTSGNGLACIGDGTMGTILRSDRVGGRVWVLCDAASAPTVGSRTAYVKDTLAASGALVLSATATGNTAISNIIIHAIDAGDKYTFALLEFATK